MNYQEKETNTLNFNTKLSITLVFWRKVGIDIETESIFFINSQQKNYMMEFGQLYYSPNWQRLSGEKLKHSLDEEIEKVLIQELHAGHTIKVCIGTDSQVKGAFVVFVTAIVFIRKGKGGFMLTHRTSYEQKISVRRRMIIEATHSIEVGYQINSLLEKYSVNMEIHADVNTSERYTSHVAFKEVMGYAMAMGFVFKAKPDAYASSSCADKIVKGGRWPKKKVA